MNGKNRIIKITNRIRFSNQAQIQQIAWVNKKETKCSFEIDNKSGGGDEDDDGNENSTQ